MFGLIAKDIFMEFANRNTAGRTSLVELKAQVTGPWPSLRMCNLFDELFALALPLRDRPEAGDRTR